MSGLLAPEQRRFTFATMSTVAVVAYNNLSVTAALPTLGDKFGNLQWLPWVITIELVTAAVSVLAVGPIIDAIGARRVQKITLVTFVVTSVMCAMAPTLLMLIVARGLQGIAAGALLANVLAGMGLGVPLALRPRAYAANSSMWAIMGIVGPAIAAALLVAFGWRAIFLVNVPVAFAAGAIGWNAFPEAPEGGASHRNDVFGLVLMSAFTLATLLAVSALSLWSVPLLLVSFGLLAMYVMYERRTPHAVLQIRHLTNPKLRWLHITGFLIITAGISTNAFLPVYLKGARGTTTEAAAFAVAFLAVGWTVGAFTTSKFTESVPLGRIVLVTAWLLTAASFGATVAVLFGLPLVVLFVLFTMVGAGLGGVSSTALILLQQQSASAEMGRVNAAHQFVRSLGFSYGSAMGGAILFGVVASRLGDADAVRELLGEGDVLINQAAAEALERGYSWAMVVSAGVSVLGLWAAWSLERQTRT